MSTPVQPGPFRKSDGEVVWMCNCATLCKGVWVQLANRKAWQRHAPLQDISVEQFLRQEHHQSAGSTPGPSYVAQRLSARPSASTTVPRDDPYANMPPLVDDDDDDDAANDDNKEVMQDETPRSASCDPSTRRATYRFSPGCAPSLSVPQHNARDASAAVPHHSPMEIDELDEYADLMHDIEDIFARAAPDEDDRDAAAPLPQPDDRPDGVPPAEEVPEYGYAEDVDIPQNARRREVREALDCVRVLQEATLDSGGLADVTLNRLRAPSHAPPEVNALERASLRMLLARGDASQDNYEDNRAAFLELHPEDDIPSYDQIKRKIAEVTGVGAVHTHMCTFPLGPQIQAMYASPENARLMCHRTTRTEEILTARQQGSTATAYIDDVYHGTDYLREVQSGRIRHDDTVVMFSLDGAQLYANKTSDCWFFIWVLFDLPPDVRYKKRYVLPGGVIGGPNKPKNVDSFLLPALAHLAALQREGLFIWDAARQVQFRSAPYLLMATADGPGMTYLSGLVGHQGGHGCRLYCGMRGRLKPSANTYYPAAMKPDDYDKDRSDHADVDLRSHATVSSQEVRTTYLVNARRVIALGGRVEYQRIRLETGIAKPSIFMGLPRVLPLPTCFASNLMHLITLNLTDLFLSLFRGTLVCEPTDNKADWPWAVLADRGIWRAHARLVADATAYLPGSFDRPPRNPAEKISSGYKAWEYLLYVYGLLPGLLRPLLASQYWRHFCKFVSAVRMILQRRILPSQLRVAHVRFVEHAHDFELLYYQRRTDRLHFCRQSMHLTIHLASEVLQLGPGALYTQWTLENFIGNITREMRQHVTPYANVSERALHRCQVNALKAMDPTFDRSQNDQGAALSRDLGDGYTLLRARERAPKRLQGLEVQALQVYLQTRGLDVPQESLAVQRWAHLRLPNGQIARTARKEEVSEMQGKSVRRSRMVKLQENRFAEVRYFFEGTINGVQTTLAMVAMFSGPDIAIHQSSFGVLWACSYGGDTSRVVIDAKAISAVVAMVPLPMTSSEALEPEANSRYMARYFLIEKPGLDVASLSGTRDDEGENEEDSD
ncbi:hypothetical protein BN946_scf185037.g23 [Trametes cinnabarina]|uniref:Uncharacterized protein n=1 Tax=Pycnoporus cinnabarinus TaxID=5643 RepID=A0A060SP91_PYCCI|nr:hypothetical protein BN946_scf185037.g23 [Trametes cinnabarina]